MDCIELHSTFCIDTQTTTPYINPSDKMVACGELKGVLYYAPDNRVGLSISLHVPAREHI